MELSGWWESMIMLEKVYWIVAVPASIFFIILLILTIFGGDTDMETDGDADLDIDGDEGIGFQFITLKNLVAFFTILGWTGIACINSGLGNAPTLIISGASGLAMMLLMASIYYFMGKLTDNGTLNMKNAINGIGEVYLTIPAKRGSFGKVQIKIQGSLRTLDAMTDEEEDLKTGALIEVIDVKNENILLVKKSTN